MFLVSCETGGRRAPARWIALTRALGGREVAAKAHPMRSPTEPAVTESGKRPLRRRLACDSSGRYAARRLARNLRVPLIENEYSLECVDVTRSIHHRQLFSAASKSLAPTERARLMDQIYWPYRKRVTKAIEHGLRRGTYLIHLSVRTFAASSKGRMRRTDVGLLYDPAREDEVDFCLDWMDELWEMTPMLRVRRNYPRRGTHDSLTKAMRAQFADQAYLGIEVVLNRAWASRPLKVRDEALDGLSDALLEIFSDQRVDAA